MDWDNLRLVVAIADARSLSGAARDLNVTLSTVMRRLDALELSLSARLFDRHRKGYEPTVAGEILLQEARAIAPRIDGLKRELLGLDMRLSGTVRLTTAIATVAYLLTPALADFVQSWPTISLDISESSALLDLSRREADVALRFSNKPLDSWVGRRLGFVQYRVYAKRGAAGLPQQQTNIGELFATSRWIELNRAQGQTRCSSWLQGKIAREQVVCRVDAFNSMVALLRSGCGIGLLPDYVGASHPELIAISDPIEDLKNPAWLLTHPDLRRTARIKAFMEFVGDAVGKKILQTSNAEI
jgi:DNA-binding transcriptional LysR family regulator